MSTFTIGQLAKVTNCTIVTLRYYEKRGLFPKIKRSAGGYRLYPDSLIARVSFIKNAKSVGFDLEEIKSLLTLQAKKAPSMAVKKRTQEKIKKISDKIATLTTMKKALSKWEKMCDGKVSIDQCPILEHLYHHQE